MKAISSAQHNSVVSLLNEGYSQCQIKDKTGLGKGTISRIIKEVDRNKENNPGDCPSKLSAHDKQSIICQIKSGKLENAVEATQLISGIIPNSVTPQTVRDALKECGFYPATKKTPLLKWAHHLWRQKYHENWTVEDWKRVLWTDETKINRIGSDGKVYIWKERGEPLSGRTTSPTVKHGGGGNLMVWGCMWWNGVEKLIEVQGIMGKVQYCKILEDGVEESFEKLEMVDGKWYFQQDNDPKHMSGVATQWFEDNNI